MEKILAVVTKEKKYSERLCDYVNQKNSFVLTAIPFENVEQCSEFSKRRNVEILLVDDDLVGPEGTMGSMFGEAGDTHYHIRANKILKLRDGYSFERALADEPNRSGRKCRRGANTAFDLQSLDESEIYAAAAAFSEGQDAINKYQPAENIIREVMNNCEGMDFLKASESLGRPIRLIGVYSPVSRCGKTSFALTLSRILSKRKTLYLNLEEFSGMEMLTGEEYKVCLSDAIYHMKQGSLSAQKIYSMIYNYSGIDYIPPIRYAEDRNAVSGNDFLQLINLILQNTEYENVVIDMDRFADEASDILEICDDVYMPVLNNYLDRAKVDNFMEYLKASGRGRLAEKIVQFETPEPISRHGNASYIEAMVYGAMGDMIRDYRFC